MERIGAGEELTFRGVIAQVLRAYREHWRSLLIFGLIVFVPLGVLDVASEHLGEPLLEEDAEFDAGTITALIVTIFGLSLGSLSARWSSPGSSRPRSPIGGRAASDRCARCSATCRSGA